MNALTLGKSTGLVRANVGDSTESFQRVELANDYVARRHRFRTASKSDGKDDLCEGPIPFSESVPARKRLRPTYDEGGRNHGERGRDGVQNDFVRRTEVVRSKDEESEQATDQEQTDSEPRKRALERSADRDAEELSDDVESRQAPGSRVPVPRCMTVVVAADLANSGVSASERLGDRSDSGLHAGRHDEAASAALGDC
jgi:hypothetical protein